MKEQYQKILQEYQALGQNLSATAKPGELKELGRRQAALASVAEKIQKLERLEKEMESNTALLNADDKDLAAMAKVELQSQNEQILLITAEIETLLVPRDLLDDRSAILEIRAAAGGDESSLFAAELFRMYGKYAEQRGWKLAVVSSSRSEAGGYKEVIAEIHGAGVYGELKFESGVHRVQRVPATEKSGRVHTSTVTAAVLPIVPEDEFKIDAKDLKIETSTSRGAGGQSVNTTYSAIKITHLPTGITASSQDERSQVQNRQKALQVLTARVFGHQQEEKIKALSQKRKSQIGSGDRSEKIRTYNFPQDRLTDHRINQNFKQINLILEGKLSPIVEALQQADLEMKKSNMSI